MIHFVSLVVLLSIQTGIETDFQWVMIRCGLVLGFHHLALVASEDLLNLHLLIHSILEEVEVLEGRDFCKNKKKKTANEL